MSFQKIIAVGKLGRDLEMNPAKTVGKTSMAVDCGFGEHKSTTWFNLVFFGKNAESASRFMTKGKEFLVEGEIKTGSYESKDGVKVNTFDLIVQKWSFVGDKAEGGETSKRSTAEARKAMKSDTTAIDEIGDDEVPF